ncbi:uncharacterized protein OCT59_001306 [Rhizophagus irregularis]|uniref:uncharacterized protein n=1 Tax=Rhizophagus irregularis TaxID=588596 RepID=UPI00331DDA8C|nr:hypothetical protein OCT59_001306 [Rhizophagus irregularis]
MNSYGRVDVIISKKRWGRYEQHATYLFVDHVMWKETLNSYYEVDQGLLFDRYTDKLLNYFDHFTKFLKSCRDEKEKLKKKIIELFITIL